MTKNNKLVISADKPLEDPKDDRFGYAPFASHLADSILKMRSDEGFVIAIYGPWGSGKTTVLNFVEHAFGQKPEGGPTIIPFNPWLFSGHQDLTTQFFRHLLSVVSKREGVLSKGMKHLSAFAGVISETPIPYSFVAKFVSWITQSKKKDITQLKNSAESALREWNKPLLVIIDDIDRLTSEEVRQLFRVIKIIANFPNIIYLIALDKKVAIQALKTEQDIPGEEYLEKIVQVPFELPIPDRSALRTLLTEKLDAMLAGTPEELFDQAYWGNIYLEGIDHFIGTPRDVVRLTNTLFITYPSLRKEVNAVDFIAIETLRVFASSVYETIRRNSDSFTGQISDTGLEGKREDVLKAFHDSWLDQEDDRDKGSIKRLVSRLFPMVHSVWGGPQYGSDYLSEWQKNRCICSPDVFPIYFKYAIPLGDISNSEMKAILEILGNAQAFGVKLEELASQRRPDGTTRFKTFIQRIGDYTKSDIRLGSINPMIDVFFDIGDNLLKPEDEQRGPADIGTNLETYWILVQLLERLDQKARDNVLLSAISKGKAVSLIVYFITLLGQAHGKYGSKGLSEEERFIGTEELEQLEKIALEKIRASAHRDDLLQRPLLGSILHRWKDWGDKIEVKSWVEQTVVEDERLIQFVMAFMGKTYIQPFSNVIGTIQNRLDPKWLEPFIDPSSIIDRIRLLEVNEKTTDEQRIALDQFITEYCIREKGGDPGRELD